MDSVSAIAPEAPPAQAAEPTLPPAPRNRLGPRWFNYLKAWLGLPWQRRLARGALYVPAVRRWEAEFTKLDDAALKTMGLRLRGRARGGEALEELLPEAFGLVCVAAKRFIGLRPFDVQVAAGAVMHFGGLAELATGEGKTLTATFPTFLNALVGKGAHVTTVNDYLARRDAEWMAPIYRGLGLSIGVLQAQMPDNERREAYLADITYGTASEFGFDFLRDRLKASSAKGQDAPFWAPWMRGGGSNNGQDTGAQRGHHFALVDEADNIFVDEARTPLIIANPTRLASPEETVVFLWADKLVRQMQPGEHFLLDQKKQKLELTPVGRQMARYANPPSGPNASATDKLLESVEQALHAHYRFRLDQHYMIENDKIVIIDEATGRRMPDRHWREGLHQAVEAKEGVPINQPSDHAAQITFQSFFRLYTKLSGMTGTAVQNRWELRRVYKLWVVGVPTNRPVVRTQLPDRVFPNEDAKFAEVVQAVARLRDRGRAILIGTRSVEKSEKLSKLLHAAGVEHEVINARFHDREAEIVKRAGIVGKVTVATNMAGRGTDIKPEEKVLEAGGLHVLGTERHEALRIDRQLAGRAGRQGNPGSAQFFLSLEDELLESLGSRHYESLKERGLKGGSDNWDRFLSFFRKAQRRTEARHFRNRVDLMVHEKHRQEILKDLGADPYVD